MTELSETAGPGLRLTLLAVRYTQAAGRPHSDEPEQSLLQLLRLLPALYGTLLDIDPYGDGVIVDSEDYDTGAIPATVDEEQYASVRNQWAELLGNYDVYLDTPVEDMRFSDTPVAVSLSEQIADIFQCMADFATAVYDVPDDAKADILADMKYRFHSYLADTLCSAMKAANTIALSNVLNTEEE